MKNLARSLVTMAAQRIDEITLKRDNPGQLAAFYKYVNEQIGSDAESLKIFDKNVSNTLIHETWSEFSDEIIEQFIKRPSHRFFSCPILIDTMTGLHFKHESEQLLSFIEKNVPSGMIDDLLKEDLIGGPVLLRNTRYKTSLNRIIHAFQFSLLASLVGGANNLNGKTIVEWGGGFGGLARVTKKLAPTATYIIIDIPAVCIIQKAYLSATVGDMSVNLITGSNTYSEGCINIIPNHLINESGISPENDIFVSSWAISESSMASQELVLRKSLFGADSALVIHQPKCTLHPHSEFLANALNDRFDYVNKFAFPYWTDQTIVLASRSQTIKNL